MGTEYCTVFACSSSALLNNTAGKQFFERMTKRTLLHYKQRDMVDGFNRSVFYTLMLKGILSISTLGEMKAYRLLSTTASDVYKLDELKGLEEETK